MSAKGIILYISFQTMIKGRSPFPFETIAVAISFSPGMESLIAEAKRLSMVHGSVTIFIHVGKKTSEKQRRLGQALTANRFHDGNSRVYWESAGDISSFLQICKHEVVDLILAGCSDKDNFALPSGRFAHELGSRAKSSVLFYCRQLPSGAFRDIYVNASDHKKTEWTVATSIYLAEKEKANQLVLFDEAGEGVEEQVMTKKASSWSAGLRTAINQSGIRIVHRSTKGVSVNEFAFQNNADLLIINSPDHHLRIFDRIFNTTTEKILSDPPCHILIIHSRLLD